MTRTIQSQTTTRVEVATHLGWTITFRYDITAENPIPANVNATGTKAGAASFNASLSGTNQSIHFNGYPFDSGLAQDVFKELTTLCTL